MVVRTPTDNVDAATEYKRKALDVHMYVTANLKSIVWKTSANNSTFSVSVVLSIVRFVPIVVVVVPTHQVVVCFV